MTRVVVIGAGNGGLTTAVMLAKAGLQVTVLEAHTYPGGCAGTFRRKHYRFDAGATLAGGFNPNEIMDLIAKQVGIKEWKAQFSDPAMSVHLSDGTTINRYGDNRRWGERITNFGEESLAFWKWQERTADALWDFASRSPPFPPQGIQESQDLLRTGISWAATHLLDRIRPTMLVDAVLPVSHHLKDQDGQLRQFIDGQLLISAQAISSRANALFSASALDLPRRGVVHMEGGIGTIAKQLEQAVIDQNGIVHYKQQVTKLRPSKDGYSIHTNKGMEFEADIVVANLSPWNLRSILAKPPSKIHTLPDKPQNGWGAFMLYLGIDQKFIPEDTNLHHQIIGEGPLTEGNTIFISLSPTWDSSRAPDGKRAITISTHTTLGKWWSIFHNDRMRYEAMKEHYTHRMLQQARRIFPQISKAELIEPGTPVTFQHFTRRKFGWVGGFPQKSLFETFAPKINDRLWLVGDSIFPGQSTAAVSLGGLRVARSIMNIWH